ncbi:Glutamate receptor ionotropic, delta-1 [Amphibalanus amphitrite]|uniref:Glutamate receptor ionotropic, delta-1 n=1 Tax=Amphibalanus amphitrite TaxID=1232801 RepID=A0A6A4VGR7_AMPAM|nr:Glutamate receptor ionotropic, delta-1 [Amphibalanus amphitrite]
MVGELQAGRADMTVSEVSFTNEREQVIDYTQTVSVISRRVYVHIPTVLDSWLARYSRGISAGMVALSLAAVVLLALTHRFCERILARAQEDGCREDWKDTDDGKMFLEVAEGEAGLADTLWIMLGLMLQQGADDSPSGLSSRVAFLSCLLLGLLLTTAYSATLISFLSSSGSPRPPFADLQGLTKMPDWSAGWKEGELIENVLDWCALRDNPMPDCHTLTAVWNGHVLPDKRNNLVQSYEEGFKKVARGNYAFIAPNEAADYQLSKMAPEIACRVHKLEVEYAPGGIALGLQNNSPYKELFDQSQLLLERPVSLVAAPIMPTPGEGHRAVAVSRVFGDDLSPGAWRGFKDHFLLVKQANIARGVTVWQDAVYRSVELRLCLTGAPAEYVREEAAQDSKWVQNDEQILEHLQRRPSNVRGRGVSSEDIPVLGEVWRTVKVGGLSVRDQRFVVVRGLVVPAILGIDFWSRLGSMKLDLRARRLLLEEKGVELELLSASQPQDTTSAQRVDLKLRRDVTVPPATEALVPVKRGGLRPGGEYLLESVGGGELPVVHVGVEHRINVTPGTRPVASRPRHDHPFRYVLQVQDVFSRYLMLMPAEDNTAETAARLVYDRWICTFDVPLVITSDRGPHFAAETFRAMCRRIGVRHRMGAPQHAQSQGQVERQNHLQRLDEAGVTEKLYRSILRQREVCSPQLASAATLLQTLGAFLLLLAGMVSSGLMLLAERLYSRAKRRRDADRNHKLPISNPSIRRIPRTIHLQIKTWY